MIFDLKLLLSMYYHKKKLFLIVKISGSDTPSQIRLNILDQIDIKNNIILKIKERGTCEMYWCNIQIE